jgi:iron complex outermembrane recepter protein
MALTKPLSRQWSHHRIGVSTAAIGLALFAAPAFAANEVVADAAEVASEDSEPEDIQEIIVVGTRVAGSVETDVPPTAVLSEADVAATGASSIADVLAAVAPQTGSGRGRGSGPPIILLNGQRISSFREIRDLPPEAIKQVQIFPEEIALQYGFRPDQRVVNFILKDNFASFSAEVEYAAPEKGGFSTKEFESTMTRIGKSTRINIDLEYESRSRLTEDERGVLSSGTAAPYSLQGNVSGLGVGGEIDPALSALAGRTVTVAAVPANATMAGFAANANQAASGDIGQFRTLLPSFQRFEANTSWSKSLAPQTNVTLNATFEQQDQQSLLGLPFASLTVPGGTASSPFTQNVQLNRYFTSPRPLSRDSKTQTASAAAGFNTLLGDWRLALTGDYVLVDSESRTFTGVDTNAMQAAINTGVINPFTAMLGSDLLFTAPDTSDSTVGTLTLRSTVSGKPFTLPAGPVLLTLRKGFDRQTIDSVATRRGTVSAASLKRENLNASLNAEIPLVERGLGALGGIGNLSINGNFGIADLSDFGTLIEYGAGLRWSPFENLSLGVSMIGDENAPGLGQLGNPLVVTPNVAIFDFTRGESRFVDLVTGGNPLLVGESRRDLKISIDWQPKFIKDLSLQAEYFRNRSSNTTAAFPLLTSEIEAAFPGRVTRDGAGQLVRVDQRPVNFDEERSQRLRWSFNISGNIGPAPQGGGFGGGGGGRPPGAGGPPGGGSGGGRPPGAGGGGRGPMGGGMMPGGGPPSRWSLALSHTIRLEEKISIAPGLPVLDLLNGSAVSSLGGAPRHELTLSGGVFTKGLGLRLEGNYRSATRVDGNTLTGTSDLRFGDLASLNAFFFINLDQRGNLTKKLKWLKGSRIAFRIDNVLNDVIDVRDASGTVPLSYQRGLLDPQGRVFELSFRKRF